MNIKTLILLLFLIIGLSIILGNFLQDLHNKKVDINYQNQETYCKEQIKVRDMSYLPAICFKYLLKDFN